MAIIHVCHSRLSLTAIIHGYYKALAKIDMSQTLKVLIILVNIFYSSTCLKLNSDYPS